MEHSIPPLILRDDPGSKSDAAVRRILLVLGITAVAAWGAVAALPDRSPRAHDVVQRTIVGTHRRQLDTDQGPVVIHDLRYRAAGGRIGIEWYDSDFEPLEASKTAVVSLMIDGAAVASTIKTSLTGTYEDGDGELVWYGTLTRGTHIIQVRVAGSGLWGVPYTDAGQEAIDELLVSSEPAHVD